jgi:bifunctional non-homologous end joining protein LigD
MSKDERSPRTEPPDPAPMLATLVAEAFDDPGWGFEPKWDGIRAIAVCNTETTLITRNAKDVTPAYPELQSLHDSLVALEAMLDGEIVAFEDGRPSFQRIQQRMHLRDPDKVGRMAKSTPVVFMAFDILYLDGRDLTGEPLRERRRLFEEVLVPNDTVQMSPMVEGAGTALFAAAEEQDLAGILAKDLESKYEPGARSRSWLKVKVTFDADVVIVGWTEGSGRRSGTLGSLVMAVYDGDELRYVGNVGTGFDRSSLDDALDRLQALGEADPPFSPQLMRSTRELRGAHWVPPVLVAKVEHRQLTSAGRLRAPSFQGFRDEKAPADCTYDQLTG